MEVDWPVLLLTMKSMLLRPRRTASVRRRARRAKVGRLKGSLQEPGLPEVLILDEVGRQLRLSRALADSTVDTKAVFVPPNPLYYRGKSQAIVPWPSFLLGAEPPRHGLSPSS